MSSRQSTRILASSEITPADTFFNRRQVIAAGRRRRARVGHRTRACRHAPAPAAAGEAPKYTRNTKYSTTEKPNSYDDITSYNNFYELGTDKADPKANAASLQPRPWNVHHRRRGEVKGTFSIEDIIKPHRAGRAHLPLPLRRSLVDGRARGWASRSAT